MSDWDSASAKMDAAVDARLADAVSYSIAGAPANVIDAFIIIFAEGLGLGPIDGSLGSRNRLKVAKTLVPEPSRADRIVAAKLGDGIFRPSGEDPEEQGRYWIFDLQKVAA